MSKSSALDRAIDNLDREIQVLQLAKQHLLKQKEVKARIVQKPRGVPREDKNAS